MARPSSASGTKITPSTPDKQATSINNIPDGASTTSSVYDKNTASATPATSNFTPSAPVDTPNINTAQDNNQQNERVILLKDPPRPYKHTLHTKDIIGGRGTESMFNQYAIFSVANVNQRSFGRSSYLKDLHYDIRYDALASADISQNNFTNYSNIKPLLSIAPTEANIILWGREANALTTPLGAHPYSPVDFAYLKFYHKIPNNRLITLTRYAFPCYDNAKTTNDEAMIPVAQMLTHFGEGTGNDMKEIMSPKFGAIWKEIEATVQEVDGNERGFGAGIEGVALGQKYTNSVGQVVGMFRGDIGRWDGSAQKEQEWLKEQWKDQGAYWNQVFGPVNVINKTYMRDRGLKYDQDINLKFHYTARSWQGINPKIAMLDIFVNFLMTIYSNAKFWGGATRYFPNYQDKVGFLGSQKEFYNGNYDKYFGSVLGELKGFGSEFLEGLTKMFSGGGGFDQVLSSLKTTGLNFGMGKLASQTRPKMLSIKSLLSGVPIGEWHLTVGNPIDPTFVMGNMIVDDAGFEFGEELGFDDFPTEVTFTVKLKHGRPRDSGDIESMMNLGNGRLSYSPLVKMPSQQNTHGDASNKKEQEALNQRNNYDKTSKTVSKEEMIDRTLDEEEKGAYNRIRSRMKTEWGNQYSESKQLIYLLDKTKGKF